MRKTTFGPLLIAATLLAGCIPTEDPVLYTVPGAATDRRVSVPQQTISVREVSLPTYAANEEISVLVTGGQIAEDGNNLWADDPVRAVTLRLTRAIGDLTRRTVAADPWPYRAPAEVTVDSTCAWRNSLPRPRAPSSRAASSTSRTRTPNCWAGRLPSTWKSLMILPADTPRSPPRGLRSSPRWRWT